MCAYSYIYLPEPSTAVRRCCRCRRGKSATVAAAHRPRHGAIIALNMNKSMNIHTYFYTKCQSCIRQTKSPVEIKIFAYFSFLQFSAFAQNTLMGNFKSQNHSPVLLADYNKNNVSTNKALTYRSQIIDKTFYECAKNFRQAYMYIDAVPTI